MTQFKITGTLKLVKPIQNVSESFKKREFVVTDNSSKYEQHYLFQLSQDKCDMIDKFNIGEQLTVTFDIRGREWTPKDSSEPKYFVSLDAWRLDSGSTMGAPVSAGSKSSAAQPLASSGSSSSDSSNNSAFETNAEEGNTDDLPF